MRGKTKDVKSDTIKQPNTNNEEKQQTPPGIPQIAKATPSVPSKQLTTSKNFPQIIDHPTTAQASKISPIIAKSQDNNILPAPTTDEKVNDVNKRQLTPLKQPSTTSSVQPLKSNSINFLEELIQQQNITRRFSSWPEPRLDVEGPTRRANSLPETTMAVKVSDRKTTTFALDNDREKDGIAQAKTTITPILRGEVATISPEREASFDRGVLLSMVNAERNPRLSKVNFYNQGRPSQIVVLTSSRKSSESPLGAEKDYASFCIPIVAILALSLMSYLFIQAYVKQRNNAALRSETKPNSVRNVQLWSSFLGNILDWRMSPCGDFNAFVCHRFNREHNVPSELMHLPNIKTHIMNRLKLARWNLKKETAADKFDVFYLSCIRATQDVYASRSELIQLISHLRELSFLSSTSVVQLTFPDESPSHTLIKMAAKYDVQILFRLRWRFYYGGRYLAMEPIDSVWSSIASRIATEKKIKYFVERLLQDIGIQSEDAKKFSSAIETLEERYEQDDFTDSLSNQSKNNEPMFISLDDLDAIDRHHNGWRQHLLKYAPVDNDLFDKIMIFPSVESRLQHFFYNFTLLEQHGLIQWKVISQLAFFWLDANHYWQSGNSAKESACYSLALEYWTSLLIMPFYWHNVWFESEQPIIIKQFVQAIHQLALSTLNNVTFIDDAVKPNLLKKLQNTRMFIGIPKTFANVDSLNVYYKDYVVPTAKNSFVAMLMNVKLAWTRAHIAKPEIYPEVLLTTAVSVYYFNEIYVLPAFVMPPNFAANANLWYLAGYLGTALLESLLASFENPENLLVDAKGKKNLRMVEKTMKSVEKRFRCNIARNGVSLNTFDSLNAVREFMEHLVLPTVAENHRNMATVNLTNPQLFYVGFCFRFCGKQTAPSFCHLAEKAWRFSGDFGCAVEDDVKFSFKDCSLHSKKLA